MPAEYVGISHFISLNQSDRLVPFKKGAPMDSSQALLPLRLLIPAIPALTDWRSQWIRRGDCNLPSQLHQVTSFHFSKAFTCIFTMHSLNSFPLTRGGVGIVIYYRKEGRSVSEKEREVDAWSSLDPMTSSGGGKLVHGRCVFSICSKLLINN